MAAVQAQPSPGGGRAGARGWVSRLECALHGGSPRPLVRRSDACGDPRPVLGLAVGLAERRPLTIDDAQWADEPSLRWLAYLALRLDDLPLAVVLTVREGEPPVEAAELAETVSLAAARLSPAPLSEDGTATLLRRRLGPETSEPFSRACHEATAGNPLALSLLVSSFEEQGIEPTAQAPPGGDPVAARALCAAAVAGDGPRRLGDRCRLPALGAQRGPRLRRAR